MAEAVGELLWEEQQRVDRARIRREGRKVLQSVLAIFALIVLIVAVAARV